MRRTALAFIASMLLVSVSFASHTHTFDGTPSSPQPFYPDDWDVTVHSLDRSNWETPSVMQAGHGPDCSGPPNTHPTTTNASLVFICNDHVMTAIESGGYSLIYLTPNEMVDFSNSEAVISFDVSTKRTSTRDWIDVWITPFVDNDQLALDDWLPDLDGVPRRGLRVRMIETTNTGSGFNARLIDDYNETILPGINTGAYEDQFETSFAVREYFQLRLTKTHIKFWMPNRNITFVDTDYPEQGWSQGVVQFGHHSYNPDKGVCDEPCTLGPNTWHWDNVSISPSVPFTMIKPDRREIWRGQSTRLVFPQPAPANSFLRFAAISRGVDVSFDDGHTWTRGITQKATNDVSDHAYPYWHPVPAGTTVVHIRESNPNTWYGGYDWYARDISIWSENGVGPTPTPSSTATPAPTNTPGPPTATPAPTNTPLPTPTLPPNTTLTFNDLPGANVGFSGSYGGATWPAGQWFLSGPWGSFTTKSMSFTSGRTSSSITFAAPRAIVRLDAYNGGGNTTVTVTCGGTYTATVPGGALVTLSTGLSGTCSTATIGSSNGWDTNFDNIVVAN